MPFPQIAVSGGKESVIVAVEEEVAAFDQFFQNELQNDPLVRSELAILKTYLFWKTREAVVSAAVPETTDTEKTDAQ